MLQDAAQRPVEPFHLVGADLAGADFHGALIFECDLRDARLADADLHGVLYDAKTH